MPNNIRSVEDQDDDALDIVFWSHAGTQKLTISAFDTSVVSEPIDAPAVIIQVFGGTVHWTQGPSDTVATDQNAIIPTGEIYPGHKAGNVIAFMRHASSTADIEIYVTPMEAA